MRLSKRTIDNLNAPEKVTFVWDDTMKGFGLKLYPNGRKMFVLQGRLIERVRRYTIGQYGSPWSPDQARQVALSYLAQLAQGIDPTEEKRAKRLEGTLEGLVDQYLEEVAVRKKPSTRDVERSVLKRHLIPLLGKKRISEIGKRDVQKMMVSIAAGKTAVDVRTGSRGRAIVKGGPGAANRTADAASALLNFAMDLGLRDDNPAIGVKKFTLKRHDRYLNRDELERLGDALISAQNDGISHYAIAVIRFMILSGCRSGEARNLQWDWIDWDHNLIKLPDSKTGQRPLLLGDGAMKLLESQPRLQGSPLVFPSAVGGTTPISIQRVWRSIRTRADLNDLRLHDLRHNFASTAVSSGQSLYIVGKLLGHNQSQTTQRYAHLAPDPVRQAANEVSQNLANRLGM